MDLKSKTKIKSLKKMKFHLRFFFFNYSIECVYEVKI
jgi:hypothetical protein